MQEPIHLRDEFRKRDIPFRRKDAQRCLHNGHDQSSSYTFSSYIGKRNSESVLAYLDEVVVVAAYATRGKSERSHVAKGRLWICFGK